MKTTPQLESNAHKEQCRRRTYWEEKNPRYIKEEGYFYPNPWVSFFVKPYAFKGNADDLCNHYQTRGSTRKSKEIAYVLSSRPLPRQSRRRSSIRPSARRSVTFTENRFKEHKDSVEKLRRDPKIRRDRTRLSNRSSGLLV